MYAFPNDGVVSIRWCSASVDYKTIQRAIKWDSFSLNDFFPLDVIGVKRYRYPTSCATDPLPLREIGIPRDFLSPARLAFPCENYQLRGNRCRLV